MIPAYQSVDILLGSGDDLEKPPRQGYVVREAGYYDRPQCLPNNKATFFTESLDEATEVYRLLVIAIIVIFVVSAFIYQGGEE